MTRTAYYRIIASGAKGGNGYNGGTNSSAGGNGCSITKMIETTSNSIICKYQLRNGGAAGDGNSHDGGKGGDGVRVSITDIDNGLNNTNIIFAAGGGGGGAQEGGHSCYGGNWRESITEAAVDSYINTVKYSYFPGQNGIGKSDTARGGRAGGRLSGIDPNNGGQGSNEGNGGAGGGPGYHYGGGGGGGGYYGGAGGGARNSTASGGGSGSTLYLPTTATTIPHFHINSDNNDSENASLTIAIDVSQGNTRDWSDLETLGLETTENTYTINFWDNPTLVNYSTQTTGNFKTIYFTDLPGSDVLYSNATFTYNIPNPTPSNFGYMGGTAGYIQFSKDDDDNKLTKYTIDYQATSDINKKSDWKLLTVYTGVSNYKIDGTDFSEIYKRTDNTNDDTVSNYLYEGKPLSHYFKVKSTFTSGGTSGYKTTINGTVYDLDDVFERI